MSTQPFSSTFASSSKSKAVDPFSTRSTTPPIVYPNVEDHSALAYQSDNEQFEDSPEVLDRSTPPDLTAAIMNKLASFENQLAENKVARAEDKTARKKEKAAQALYQ